MARLMGGQGFLEADVAKGNLLQEQVCTEKFDVIIVPLEMGVEGPSLTHIYLFIFCHLAFSIKWLFIVCWNKPRLWV